MLIIYQIMNAIFVTSHVQFISFYQLDKLINLDVTKKFLPRLVVSFIAIFLFLINYEKEKE